MKHIICQNTIMTILQRKLLILLSFLLAQIYMQAQPFVLKGGEYKVKTTNFTKILMDGSRQITFPEAQKRWHNNEFRLLDSLEVPENFSRGAYNYWLALEVKNETKDTFPLLVYLRRMNDDSIWYFSKNQAPQLKILTFTGDFDSTGYIPYQIQYSGIWKIAPGATDTILIKYYSFKVGIDFTPIISDVRRYGTQNLHEHLRDQWIFLFGFGAIFSVLLYSLSMFFGTKDKTYFWYAAYCAVMGYIAWWNFEDDVDSLRFLSKHYEWTYTKTIVQTILVGFTYSQFMTQFFKGKSPIIEKASYWFNRFCLFVVLLEVFLLYYNQHWSWVFYWWLRIFVTTYAFVMLYFIRNIPEKPSRLILMGMFSLLLGEVLSDFTEKWTSHFCMLGAFLDLGFFTVALAYRTRQITRDKSDLALQVQKMDYEREIALQNIRLNAAQDVHDEVGSTLTKISLAAQVAARMPDLDKEELQKRMVKLATDAQHASGQLREILFTINPDFDSFSEMQAYFREYSSEFWRDTIIDLSFDFPPQDENPLVAPDKKRQLFLILKEAQNNIAKHAKASKVNLTFLLTDSEHFRLEISDNGKGFLLKDKNGFSQGISGMKKRAESIGAVFSLESSLENGAILRVKGRI
jgi:signal transduction histidine kinase